MVLIVIIFLCKLVFRYFLPENEPQLYIKWFLSFSKQKRQNNFWTKLAVLVIVQWATACLCIEFFTVTSQPFHSGLYFNLKSKSTFLAKDWWFFKDLLTFSKIKGKFIGNVQWCIKFHSKHGTVSLLCLLRNLMHQTLGTYLKTVLRDQFAVNSIVIFNITSADFVLAQIFWEGHKIWKNLPLKIWRYWVKY